VVTGRRFAIYFIPPPASALYEFGSAVLGYDCYSGKDVPSPPAHGFTEIEWRQWTEEPRRYGFHATLNAPFRLRSEFGEDDLVDELDRFAGACDAPPPLPVSLTLFNDFAALTPADRAPGLTALADSCVQFFDKFRMPLTEAERNRRLGQNLTARQIEHLERWGYPYVFEEFAFHMTLTGRLPPHQSGPILKFLHADIKRRHVPSTIPVERIALLRQDEPDQRFRVIFDAALR
jgi:putative phosphonate metabolism protein